MPDLKDMTNAELADARPNPDVYTNLDSYKTATSTWVLAMQDRLRTLPDPPKAEVTWVDVDSQLCHLGQASRLNALCGDETHQNNSKPNNGGPAFPRLGEGFGNPKYDEPGMTLRDWFAGQALVGLIRPEVCWTDGVPAQLRLAKDAYQFADAMLAERDKEGAE